MPALKNPSHELFAQHCATGTDKAEAYRTVYPKANPDSARSAGARLFANVCERVAELQAASATEKTLTMRERREFLARVVRADLDKLDLDKDGDLIQEKIVTETERGTTVKVKLPGKRECVMSDAELAGDLVKPGVEVSVDVKVNIVTESQRAKIMELRRLAVTGPN